MTPLRATLTVTALFAFACGGRPQVCTVYENCCEQARMDPQISELFDKKVRCHGPEEQTSEAICQTELTRVMGEYGNLGKLRPAACDEPW